MEDQEQWIIYFEWSVLTTTCPWWVRTQLINVLWLCSCKIKNNNNCFINSKEISFEELNNPKNNQKNAYESWRQTLLLRLLQIVAFNRILCLINEFYISQQMHWKLLLISDAVKCMKLGQAQKMSLMKKFLYYCKRDNFRFSIACMNAYETIYLHFKIQKTQASSTNKP